MMSITNRRLGAAAVALSVVLTSGSYAADKFQKISGSQISARLSGMEITDGVHYADVFQSGGNLLSYSMGRKTPGKWRVNKDALCLDRGKEEQACYEVWLAGKKVELRRPGVVDMPFEGILQKPKHRQ